MSSLKILGVEIDQVSRSDLREILKEQLQQQKLFQIATVNPEFLVEASRNKKFQQVLQNCDLKVCDGAGISILARLLMNKKIVRISGVEVAETLCEVCAEQNKSLFFLGGFGVADKAAAKMKKKYPHLRVAETFDGDENTLLDVEKTSPDAILVAFGAPKQEYWLVDKGRQINSLKIGIGVGGTFDFWAGKAKRAPQIMQKMGLEWFWRLILYPRRIKRIFLAVIIFPILMIKERIYPQ
ncbi:WecB/TagA/CpsF family glycosyltransferase [Candidatus Gracilibacteria bacterium]|nr:WecB/TagA/CpsF family glycosyltransferase [Candidatus Gracilibacteria bacterium]